MSLNVLTEPRALCGKDPICSVQQHAVSYTSTTVVKAWCGSLAATQNYSQEEAWVIQITSTERITFM